MPLFIKLAIIWQIGFWRNSENFAAQNRKSAIVKPATPAQRRANDKERVECARGLNNLTKRRINRLQQCFLL